MEFFILLGAIMLASFLVSSRLKSKFKKYSKVALKSGLTGREVVEKMLQDHNITNVNITCTSGVLTDHYNPVNRTINLSQSVYSGRSISSAAVAAHECGHAIQHATEYSMLKLRSFTCSDTKREWKNSFCNNDT